MPTTTNECAICNEDMTLPGGTLVPDGYEGNTKYICDSCFDDKYFECEHCGNNAHKRHEYDVSGESWCRDCYLDNSGNCEDCGDRFANHTLTSVRSTSVCESCRSNYYECSTCGGYARELDDNDECEGCVSARAQSRSRLIKGHSYKPPVRFFGNNIATDKRGLYLGAENEVECSGDRGTAAQKLLDMSIKEINSSEVLEGVDHFCLKEDGSLDSGFEIVTQPHTLEAQENLWKQVTENMPSKLSSYPTDTCGFHVHVSRAAIGSLQLGKMLVFVNSVRNKTFMEYIAQRNSDRWARMSPKKLTDATTRNEARYEAINLQNRNTVEFRIFKGNLKFERIMKNLEFVHAVTMFCKDSSIQSEALTYENFSKFVMEKRKHGQYKYLYDFMIEGDYIPRPPKKPVKEIANEEHRKQRDEYLKQKSKKVVNS